MAPKKIQFIQQIQSSSTKLAQALEEATVAAKVYVNRGYAVNGADPIVAGDLTGHEITPEQIAAFVAFVAALNDIGAQVPELVGYDALLDQLRTDR